MLGKPSMWKSQPWSHETQLIHVIRLFAFAHLYLDDRQRLEEVL